MDNNRSKGIIVKATGGFYYVESAGLIHECKARGVFKQKGLSPCAGDNVLFSFAKEGYCVIDEILQRKNYIVRPPLANIDILVLVVSVTEPAPNTLLLDKMIAAAENKNIEPVIVFTKTDIAESHGEEEIYLRAGFTVFSSSISSFDEKDKFMSLLKGKITAFTGNSGVGKSTLLNALMPSLNLPTASISQKLGRGRHTTRTVELFPFAGGYIADTPGFSTMDIEHYELVKKEELASCFREFTEYTGQCKFTSCSHTCEKGCAVLEAVNNGEISKSRHESYKMMYEQIKDLKEWMLK